MNSPGIDQTYVGTVRCSYMLKEKYDSN